jgi:hypothetical protein
MVIFAAPAMQALKLRAVPLKLSFRLRPFHAYNSKISFVKLIP